MDLIPMRGFELGRFPLQRQINRLFEEFFGESGWPTLYESGRGSFPIDLAESDEEYLLTAEIPGIDPKAVEISVTGNTLTLKAEKRPEGEKQVKNVHRTERIYGAFQRMVSLPGDVDPAAVQASSKDGVLSIRLGKREEAKPRTIEVKVQS
ncbi:MAG: Hsp20/alpha crystallin family protein [Planctomycetes bacterium]|jgi:HSP20 family protein|nr:Hsp20/alpha crystallin family protein [Planctomycetota bacterium]